MGNTSVSSERLATQLPTTPALLSFTGEIKPTNLAEDVETISAYYKNLGYLDAKVTPTIDYFKNRKWVSVCYAVQEGQRYRIRKLDLLGNTRFNDDELLKAIQTREGHFYDFFAIRKDIETIKKKYDQSGHPVMLALEYPRHLKEPGVIDVVLRIYEDQPFEPRAYPVSDLVLPSRGEPKTNVQDNFVKLIGLITDTVEPKTWDKAGGAGSLAPYEPSFSLIIRQSPSVHRRVSAFLHGLRSLVQDWQVCLELTLVENPPADILKNIGTSNPGEVDKKVFRLDDEQRTKLLAAVKRTPTSKLRSINATMFYGQHGSIGFAEPVNQRIEAEIADSTDRYAVNLKLDLHDVKSGQAKADPVLVNIPNLKTVVIEFRPADAKASATPSLLVVRPRLLFPLEEELADQPVHGTHN